MTEDPSGIHTQASYKPVLTFSIQNRTLQLTREGGGFVFLVFGVGLGAINTGNNLLYLILAMCCSFIAVSGILSELTLRKIQIEGIPLASLYTHAPSPLTLRFTNHKLKVPSYSLRLTFPRNPGYQVDREIFILHVPHGQTVEKTLMVTAQNRGRLKMNLCRLSTSFPFGFFIKSREIDLNLEAVVFPEIRRVALPPPSHYTQEGEGIIQQRGDELFALRDFRPGDSLTAVHWKSSAKTGILRVKEFLSGGPQSYTIFLNLDDPQTNQQVAADVLEQRVSETASMAYHLIRRGDEVSLKIRGFQTQPGNSEAHLESILYFLAFAGTPEQISPERHFSST
ncbi:MAG: hypothetical protein COV67_09310 [Nitrospinae bacterium CG11_big_fil_rev_8_21_14_0_20_56_8]|nr:MAG: hypothetical protein COV67_09310 [Nitrospinae bacterium CG11_big_fil_rev_8_21_14_0_20_56_8]